MGTDLATTKLKTQQLQQHRTIKDLAGLIRAHHSRIVASLPRGVDGDAVLKKSIMAIQQQPGLLQCKPVSLFWAVSEAVQSGLEIGGHRQHCYLLPFGAECQLILGYKGMIELVRRTGDMQSASMQLVHKGDHFVYQEGDNPKLEHTPSTSPHSQSEAVTHVYVIFRLKDGAIIRNVWTAERINAHRDQYSESYRRAEVYRKFCESKKETPNPKKLSAWHTSWHNMAFKTVVRDLFSRGLLPISEAIQCAIERDNYIEAAKNPPVRRDTSLDDMLGGILEGHQAPSPAIEHMQREEEATQPEPMDDAPQEAGDTVVDVQERVDTVEQPKPKTLAELLKAATNLGQVTAIAEAAIADALDDDDATAIRQMCDERAAEIREAKSK